MQVIIRSIQQFKDVPMYRDAIRLAMVHEPKCYSRHPSSTTNNLGKMEIDRKRYVFSHTPLGPAYHVLHQRSVPDCPTALLRFDAEQVHAARPVLNGWRDIPDIFRLAILPPPRKRRLSVMLTRSTSTITYLRAQAIAANEDLFIQAIDRAFPGTLREETVRILPNTSLGEMLPFMLAHDDLWYNLHVNGLSQNAFPQSSDHTEFLEIIRRMLSFSNSVDISLFTTNQDNICDNPIDIAMLDEIPQLATTLHVALDGRYAGLLVIAQTVTWPVWLKATMSEIREAHEHAQQLHTGMEDPNIATCMATWMHASEALAYNKHESYERRGRKHSIDRVSLTYVLKNASPFVDNTQLGSALRRNHMMFFNKEGA